MKTGVEILGRPIFVGRTAVLAFQRDAASVLTYMTAPEMKTRIAMISGYEHPAFDQFADVIGRIDPVTGVRTNDRPTVVSLLFLRKITAEIADAVVQREAFLEPEERIVFGALDLDAEASDASLAAFLRDFYAAWIGVAPSAAELTMLLAAFRGGEVDAGPTAGYRSMLTCALQNAALYYY